MAQLLGFSATQVAGDLLGMETLILLFRLSLARSEAVWPQTSCFIQSKRRHLHDGTALLLFTNSSARIAGSKNEHEIYNESMKERKLELGVAMDFRRFHLNTRLFPI